MSGEGPQSFGRAGGGFHPPRSSHQRGLGAVFILSAVVYCLQMGFIIMVVEGLVPRVLLGRHASYRMFMGHFWFFTAALVLYLGLAWRRGERISLQDLLDAAFGFFLFIMLFTVAAVLLNFHDAHSFAALVPGVFHLVYGVQLMRGRPLVDVAKLR